MASRLLYRGPSIDVLHEEYAKKGRLDEHAPIKGEFTVRIEAPAEQVWRLLSDPATWTTLDPGIRDVRLEGPVAVDTRFTWKKGGARMKSRFAVVDPGREITWTGRAAGANAVHRHLLQATADGATEVRTEESMAGPLFILVFNEAKLRTVLTTWLTGLKTVAES